MMLPLNKKTEKLTWKGVAKGDIQKQLGGVEGSQWNGAKISSYDKTRMEVFMKAVPNRYHGE